MNFDRMKHASILLYFLICITVLSNAKETPRFLKYTNDQWVDSLMASLTIDQKIGQLFMIQGYSNDKSQKTDELIKLINQFQIGGIIFMQGGPLAQSEITNKLQNVSNVPLLVAIDAENGLGFRLDSTISYPSQMALGAISEDSLIYKMGYEIGKQLRLIGIHMNLAPVCDINTNPENPIINHRSFGENKDEVARKSWLYASGMQNAGIIATAKHFPGHGDTQVDSHYDLPIIQKSLDQLNSTDLIPFSYLIDQGIFAVMTGHLQVPAMEPDGKIPASLSAKIITKTLRKEMGFNGLVITDAMNMKGVGNLYSSAESSVKALKAGNDIIEIVPRLDRAIAAVKLAVKNGEITNEEIDEKCRKILSLKKWLGLDKSRLVNTVNINQQLNQNSYQLTKRLLVEKSLTVLTNKQNIIPLQQLDTLKIASLIIGSDQILPFQRMLENYTNIDHFNIGKTPTAEEIESLASQLIPYNLLIIGINGMGQYPTKQFRITEQQINLFEKLKSRKSIVCFFGNPYALPVFPSISNTESLVVTYQDDQITQELAAQLLFGATNANGKLPVSVSNIFPIHSGLNIASIARLKYTIPEEVGISSSYLSSQIDSLANLGIMKKAFPGCQVLIAKQGKVIFSRSYGFFTYENKTPVRNDNLYDLASLTKVTAALPAIMELYDEKKINLDKPFSEYFKEFKNTNKSEMTFRDILTHQARLQASIPFWLEPGSNTRLRNGVFNDSPAENYLIRVSSGLYASTNFKSQIIKDIVKSPLRAQKEYHYSDLGFSLFPTVVERISGQDFITFLSEKLYKSLGVPSICFNPYMRFPIEQIVPTEDDQTFRKELLQGYVHDELAALLGGISGNAGLFGSANDLAKIMQTYLQMGYYGGKQYFRPETISEFTKVQFPLSKNRRALGFDKPNPGISGLKNKFPAADASPASYGHTGFTGTFVWADPANQLLFIFLSNRVYPSRRNSGIYDYNIRTEMHQAIYRSIKTGMN